MNYDLTDLRLFLHVGETLNLTRAAEKSFLSPPAASTRIKQLEDAFQTPLLLRHAKGMHLTPAGEAVLGHVRSVFRQLEFLHSDLQPFATGVKGRIRLMANSTATNTFLADALSSFLSEHPDIDIELEEHPSRHVASSVAKGAADLGIVAGTVALEDLEVLPLYADELALIAPLGSPGWDDGRARLVDMLDSSRFVGLNHFNSVQTFVDRIAQGHGKRLNLRIQVGSFDAVCRMIEAGAGVAIVPRICALRYGRERLRIVALEDSWARREIHLVRQRGRPLPQTSEKLIAHLMRAAATIAGG